MKKRYKMKFIACCVAGICMAAAVQADEKTGREFSELVKEMNQELSSAKIKVERIEEARLANKKAAPEKVLPARAEALKKLEKLSRELDRAKDPAVKKEVAAQVETQVLKVAELSTDFLESMKNDVVSQDKQLEVIEESLSEVIMKMGKLKKLAAGNGKNGESPELVRYRARKSLRSLAETVEIFAARHRNAQQWGQVRQTIMLQDAILRRSTIATDKIQKLLEVQQKLYEQVLAQVTIARRGLQTEKEILAQVGLGEIAKSMLRKAAGLLLGNQSITQVGEAAFVKSEIRQQQVLSFLEQDQDAGIYSVASGSNSSSASAGYPSGYKEYLSKNID
jgi:hypothetical protein